MTSLKSRLQDAQDASTTDALTKLYNRKVLDREIPELVKSTLDGGQPASILLIDLDNFKRSTIPSATPWATTSSAA